MGEGSADFYVRFVLKDGKTIDGECTDELHPGKMYPRPPPPGYPKDYRGNEIVFGWFQVESFSFGFNVTVSDRANEADQTRGQSGGTPSAVSASKKTTPKGGGKDQDDPFSAREITITKHLDSTSKTSWLDNCYKGQPLERVEAEACRSGGNIDAVKTPFVRLVFEDVYIDSISLSLPEDALPKESLKFSYTRVQMESIWTSNDTGERKVGEPQSFGWDFDKHCGWVADKRSG